MLLTSPVHHGWEPKVIIIVEKVSKGVPSPEEVLKYLISLREGEPTPGSTSGSTASTPREARAEELEVGTIREASTSTTTASTLQAFLSILVVDLSLFRVGKDCVCLTNLLEGLLGEFLVVGVFVLHRNSSWLAFSFSFS